MSNEYRTKAGSGNSRKSAQLHRAWKKDYFEMLRKELERLKGEDVDITYRDVRKNNGVYRKACTVRFHDAQVAPTIYLDPYYDHYLHGEAVSESAEKELERTENKSYSPVLGNKYVVRAGEDLYDIAKKFGIDVGEFKAINPGLTNTPAVGTVIKVPDI